MSNGERSPHGQGDCRRDRRGRGGRSRRLEADARGTGGEPLGGFVQPAPGPPAWGDPSDLLRFGRLGETEAVFLARHGQGHVHSPSSINYRANIDALKRAGVTDIIAVSACGSFRRELYPGLFVLVDQFIDRTFARQTSFFGPGFVAHVPLARPVAPKLRQRIAAAAEAEGIAV